MTIKTPTKKYTFIDYYDDSGEWSAEDRQAQGYTSPGWYFWDETQSTCYGPYEDQDIAAKEQVRYAASL